MPNVRTIEVPPRTYQLRCCGSPKAHLFEVLWKSLQNTLQGVLGPWLRQLLQHALNSSGVFSCLGFGSSATTPQGPSWSAHNLRLVLAVPCRDQLDVPIPPVTERPGL